MIINDEDHELHRSYTPVADLDVLRQSRMNGNPECSTLVEWAATSGSLGCSTSCFGGWPEWEGILERQRGSTPPTSFPKAVLEVTTEAGNDPWRILSLGDFIFFGCFSNIFYIYHPSFDLNWSSNCHTFQQRQNAASSQSRIILSPTKAEHLGSNSGRWG